MNSTDSVQFDLQAAKDFITIIIENNRKNANKGIKKKIAFQLVGDAGLGKTSAVLQVAEEKKMDYYKLNLSQIEELGDLVGFPIKKYYIKKDFDRNEISSGSEAETKYKSVSEKQLNAWYRAGWKPVDKEPVMSYAPPEWIMNRAESGILILDDWTRADVRFIQAVMELIDRGQYISWSLPEDWHIVLTSNPDNGEYLVNSTDEAQNTRFLSGTIKYDEKVWAEWAENNEIDSRCINFMLLHPEGVTGVFDEDNNTIQSPANPRQWVNFFHTIGNLKDYKEKKNISFIDTVGQMAIGSDLTTTFISFIHNNMDKLIEPEYMILHKDEDKVMKAIGDCVGTGNDYRSDIASVLSIRFSNWLIKYASKNPIDAVILDRLHNIIVGEVFGADLSYAIAKKVYYKQRSKFVKLVSRKSFMDYVLSTS